MRLVLTVAALALAKTGAQAPNSEAAIQCADESLSQMTCRAKHFVEAVGEVMPTLYKDQIRGDIESCFDMCENRVSEEEAFAKLKEFILASDFASAVKAKADKLKATIDRYSGGRSSRRGPPKSPAEWHFRRPSKRDLERGINMAACMVHEAASALPANDPCSAASLISEADGERLIRMELRKMAGLFMDFAEGMEKEEKQSGGKLHSAVFRNARTAARFWLCHAVDVKVKDRRGRETTKKGLDFEALAGGPVLKCMERVHCRVRASLQPHKEAAKEACAGTIQPQCVGFLSGAEAKAKACIGTHVGGALARFATALRSRGEKARLKAKFTKERRYDYRRMSRTERTAWLKKYNVYRRDRSQRMSRDESYPTPRWMMDTMLGGANSLAKKKDFLVGAFERCARKILPGEKKLFDGLKWAKSGLVWRILTGPLNVIVRDEHEAEMLEKATEILAAHFKSFVSHFDLDKMAAQMEQGVCSPYDAKETEWEREEKELKPFEAESSGPSDPSVGF